MSQLIEGHSVLQFKHKNFRDDHGGTPPHFWYLLSIRVQAAVYSGGGSCDGGYVALSICLEADQTAVVPLAQLQHWPHTPWKASLGSLPAFFPHSWLPAVMFGLQDGNNRETRRFTMVNRSCVSVGLYGNTDW